MSNDECLKKHEARMTKTSRPWGFVIRISLDIRHSTLVRHRHLFLQFKSSQGSLIRHDVSGTTFLRRLVMARPVCDQLAPVRMRQRWVYAAQSAVWGLTAASVVAIGLEVVRAFEWTAVSTTTIWSVLAAGPLLAGLAGLISRHSW